MKVVLNVDAIDAIDAGKPFDVVLQIGLIDPGVRIPPVVP